MRGNYWKSKPWRWNYRSIYRLARDEDHGRLQSVWLAITFPHVHDERKEDNA